MLTVIICTKDRKNILLETLDKIFSFPDVFEVVKEIVVVNDGDDNLAEYLKSYQLTVLKNEGKGLAAGRNTGAKYASTSHILFLDDDILINEDHFRKHFQNQKEFTKRVITANRFYPAALIQRAEKTPFGRYKLNHEYNWLAGCELTKIDENGSLFRSTTLAGFSCSMSKELWVLCGGFNESFPHAGCEDNEFFIRTKAEGAELLFDESNICYHNEFDNFTLQKWIQRQSQGIKGALIITSLHPEGKEHPTYYLNTPITLEDSKEIKRIKRKRTFLAKPAVLKLIYSLTKLVELVKLPDRIVFRCYNAIWLGESNRSFMEMYHEMSKGNKLQ